MYDSDTIDAMSKKRFRTVPIHARLPESDVAELDRIADEEFLTRSALVAKIIREWVKKQRSPKQRG